MGKKIRRKALQKPKVPSEEPAEGIHLEVQPGETTIHCTFSALDPPANVYSADRAFAERTHDDIRLVFVQNCPLSGKPSTAVTIRYGRENLKRLVERSMSFYQTLSSYVQQHYPDVASGEIDPGATEFDIRKSLTERASFERMAFSEGDAEIEFYSISPIRFEASRRTGTAEQGLIRPGMAVALSSFALYVVLRQVFEIAAES